MNGFTALIGDWHFWILVISYWVGSNAISAMPMPDTTSGKAYGWFFKFANGLAANFSRAFAGKIPGTGDVMPLPGAQADVDRQALDAKQDTRARDVTGGK
jgi:hypothetical protein